MALLSNRYTIRKQPSVEQTWSAADFTAGAALLCPIIATVPILDPQHSRL